MSFSSVNKYIRLSDFLFFFSLFILRKIRSLRFTQKLRGVKQGRGVIYNEKYFEVFSQRPFWNKKVFPKQHFSKTEGFKCFYVTNIKFTIHQCSKQVANISSGLLKNVPSETKSIFCSFLL